MQLSQLGPLYTPVLTQVRRHADENSPYQAEAGTLLAQDAADTRTLLRLIHQAQKLARIAEAGLMHDIAFKNALKKQNLPLIGDNKNDLPVEDALQIDLAEKMYNLREGTNDVGLVLVCDTAMTANVHLVEKCLASPMPVLIEVIDISFRHLLLNHATTQGVESLAAAALNRYAAITRRMTVGPGLPDTPHVQVDTDKDRLYNKLMQPYTERAGSGVLHFTGTSLPSRKSAEMDGMTYEEGTRLYFEAIAQPYTSASLPAGSKAPTIDRAQRSMIRKFNKATNIRITNNDGTDISFHMIDAQGRHFTFCNSLIQRNLPGSEFFSAPRIDSAEGIIVAKGRFSEDDDNVIENLTLVFNKGQLVDYKADKGVEHFKKVVEADAGASRLGELGIGTNPHLKQHMLNGMMVEKIGGSFHVAFGRCYTQTKYDGKPVHVDNGNESQIHWDITTMLHGKDGRIYLDDTLVMDKGLWIGKPYDVLNRGWEAIPQSQRPDYWKNYDFKNKKPAV